MVWTSNAMELNLPPVELIIKRIIRENQLEATDIQVERADVVITDPYMSELFKVKITFGDDDNSYGTSYLLVKVANTEPAARKIVKLLYKSESYFYENILTYFNILHTKHFQQNFDIVPRFYKANYENGKEAIALEDLSKHGYRMLNKKQPFTEDQLIRVLQCLAKFHAMSFGLRRQKFSIYDALDCGIEPMDYFDADIIAWFRETIGNIIVALRDSMSPEIIEKLEFIHDNIEELFKTLLSVDKDKPDVFVHLDPWCNNFLFRRHPTGEDKDVVLIDFQQVTKASPALDVGFCILSNSSKEQLNKWEFYLQCYYVALSGYSSRMETPLDCVYTWEDLLADWKTYILFGMIRSIVGFSLKNVNHVVPNSDELQVLDAVQDIAPAKDEVNEDESNPVVRGIDRIKYILLTMHNHKLL